MNKTFCLWVSLVLSLMLCSCIDNNKMLAPVQQHEQHGPGKFYAQEPARAPGAVASARNEKFPAVINNYIVEKLSYPELEGYQLCYVDWLNEENLLVVTQAYPRFTDSPDIRKIYSFNLIDRSIELICESDIEGDSWHFRLKRINNDSFLFQGTNKCLFFNKHQVEKEIAYPDNAFEVDVSYDGNRIVYVTPEGMYVSKITGESPIQLDKAIAMPESRPAEPKWSYDSKYVLYSTYAAKSEYKVNIINPENLTKQTYNSNDGMLGYWFRNNTSVVTFHEGIDNGENITSQILIIDAIERKIIDLIKDGLVKIYCSPYKNKILYHYIPCNIKDGIFELGRLVLWDYQQNTEEIITPYFIGIMSSNFSPSGDAICFLGLYKQDENYDIYIIRKAKS